MNIKCSVPRREPLLDSVSCGVCDDTLIEFLDTGIGFKWVSCLLLPFKMF